MRRALVLAALASLCLAGQPRAAADPRLAARLDTATAGEVQKLVDDASAHGLPTAPLVSKALEGAAKHASPERILAAVRAQSAAMAEARAALGDTSSASEIVAGAGALMAGVARDSLVRLRAVRPGRPLEVPLVVLADLVTRNVPAGTAAGAVLAASRARARDTDLLDMRKRIEGDIAAGVSPAEATILRTRDWKVVHADGSRPASGDPR